MTKLRIFTILTQRLKIFSIVCNKNPFTRSNGINTQGKVCICISFSPLQEILEGGFIFPDDFWHLIIHYNALYCREDTLLYTGIETLYSIRPLSCPIMCKCRSAYGPRIRERRSVGSILLESWQTLWLVTVVYGLTADLKNVWTSHLLVFYKCK